MRNYVNAKEMMARAYLGLAEDALKKGEKRKDNVLRCCKCGNCNVTLKKLHKEKGIYACTKCINFRAALEPILNKKKVTKSEILEALEEAVGYLGEALDD